MWPKLFFCRQKICIRLFDESEPWCDDIEAQEACCSGYPVRPMASTTLRAVTHRLTTTPVDQLPQIASFLATSLSDCGELLSATQNQKTGKSESDNAVQIHKLKTRLVSLLQDRSFEGRWTAVVLVKATVEAGQWEVLRGCEPLVRSLVAILAVSRRVCHCAA
jgi:hypothetical protein